MASSKRFVCIHGHFYQPPRENPWLETVETQDSAAPYHDWNERICAECYATNGAARIVNDRHQIIGIVNNYARMSFNFGPTLLSWLDENAPRSYRMILEGERRSRRLFNGHSSAMAQVYNHIILPLANRRDRLTQIRWGIADYKSHYGIAPEGMWLAEAAADSESLELLAEEGIRFTVLAPHQCGRIRPLHDGANWQYTTDGSVDTTRPYLVRFPSGLSINVFFYDGAASRAIAFEGLLNSGDRLANRLRAGFRDEDRPQLVHVATDGESYGHHHKYGEMALAYALRQLEEDETVSLANYGSYLEAFPPEWEAQIVENSSWSCAHGIERWRSNCGCNGGRAGWNQLWRAPLRQALDQMRDGLALLTEEFGNKIFKDVWAARDAYIEAILERTPQVVERFLRQHQVQQLSVEDRVVALQLMEMQRHAQLMYTSCGWFFDDIGGIETVQVITYAARAMQLARNIAPEQAAPLEKAFLAKLAEAQSNDPKAGDGARIYKAQVATKQLRLEQVAAHYAISSIFSYYAEETDLFCYRVWRNSYDVYTSGHGKLVLGRVKIVSAITGAQGNYSFAVLHFGDQNITAAVKPYNSSDADDFTNLTTAAGQIVQSADFPAVIRLLDRSYGNLDYSLISLFADEQRRIVQLILNATLADIEKSLTTIYDDHASLLHYLSQASLPKPPALTLAAGFAVNAGLRRALEAVPIDQPQLRSYLLLAKADQVPLDVATLSFLADLRMKRVMIDLQMSSGTLESLDRALSMARTLVELPFELNLWQAQNIWYEIFRTASYGLTNLSDEDRPRWDKNFIELGNCLSIESASFILHEPRVLPIDGKGGQA